MEKHLLGRVLAWCSLFFMKIWYFVFTHKEILSVRDSCQKKKWSISNFTKMVTTIGLTVVVAIFSLDVLNVPWADSGKIVAALDAIFIGLWAVFFIPNRNLEWFGRTDVHSAKEWYNVFLLTREYFSDVMKSAECYFIPIVTVCAFALAVKFWNVALVLAVIALGIYLLKTLSDQRNCKAQNNRTMEEYQYGMEKRAAEQKVENERRLAEYPAVLSERDMLKSKQIPLIEALIRAKMLIIASKVDGARSRHLAEARFALDTALAQVVGTVTQTEIDLIELRVCRELGVAPEKHVPVVAAS